MSSSNLKEINIGIINIINMKLKNIHNLKQDVKQEYIRSLREIIRSYNTDGWKNRKLNEVLNQVTALENILYDEWEDDFPPPSLILNRQGAEQKMNPYYNNHKSMESIVSSLKKIRDKFRTNSKSKQKKKKKKNINL